MLAKLGLVRDWLCNEENSQWLMILDSADHVGVFYPKQTSAKGKQKDKPNDFDAIDEPATPLASFLPKNHGQILVTSRSKDVAERLTGSRKNIFDVPMMRESEALQLLLARLMHDCDHEGAEDLVRALGFLPLAISQAAAYINRKAPRMSIRACLEKSKKKMSSLIREDAGDLRRDESASNSLIARLQITFEQVRSEQRSAADLLSFMSLFNPQHIPEAILRNYTSRTMSEHFDKNRHSEGGPDENGYSQDSDSNGDETFEDDVDVLRGYSLISVAAGGDTLEMHALVQLCIREWVSSEEMEHWKRTFLATMAIGFPSGGYETWSTCQMLYPHVESVLNTKGPENPAALPDWSCLLDKVADYMHKVGNYKTAEGLLRSAADVTRTLRGNEHPDTIERLITLRETLAAQGRYKEAEIVSKEVVQIQEKVSGKKHPGTWDAKFWVAFNLMLQGVRNAKSGEAAIVAMELFEMVNHYEGEDCPNIRTFKMKVLTILAVLGIKSEETEKMVLELARVEEKSGKENPDAWHSIIGLARIYAFQGKAKSAETAYRKGLELQEKVLGEEHPDTLGQKTEFAMMLGLQGKQEEAETMRKGVLETQERVLGGEHPSTLASKADLAEHFFFQGKSKEAAMLYMEVLERQEKILGEEHPDTLRSKAELAYVFLDQGKYKEAETVIRKFLETKEKFPEWIGDDMSELKASFETYMELTKQNEELTKQKEELTKQEEELMKKAEELQKELKPSSMETKQGCGATRKKRRRWRLFPYREN